MRAVVFALSLILLATPAGADSIARQGANWVRLTLGACADPAVVAVLAARGLHPLAFRAALARWDGQDYAACWRPTEGGAQLFYSDGDGGFVPKDSLKPAPEA